MLRYIGAICVLIRDVFRFAGFNVERKNNSNNTANVLNNVVNKAVNNIENISRGNFNIKEIIAKNSNGPGADSDTPSTSR